MKNKFLKDSFLLVISSAIAQIVLIFSVPIISRIYSPEQFGIFTLFNYLALIFIPVINARFDLLIINSKTTKKANAIAQISIMISLIIIIFTILAGVVGSIVLKGYYLEIISFVLLLVFVSLTNIFTSYLNLNKKYFHISIINITRTLLMVIVQIAFGWLTHNSLGLILGFTLSYLAGIIIGFKEFKKHFKLNKNIRYLKKVFKLHSNQLFYSTPSIIINSLTFSVIVFIIGLMYSTKDVGIYGMATRILNVPIVVAGMGLSKIFMQKASEDYYKFNNFRPVLLKFSLGLFFLGLIAYGPLLLLKEEVVLLFLGRDWLEVTILFIPFVTLYVTRLIVSTISLANIVINKQHIDLIFQGGTLGLTIVSSLISYILGLDFQSFVWLNSLTVTVSFITFYIYIFKKSKKAI
ncbi:oligosaccharide flippase family protein [Staphylococcus massiliensis]|uniref:lipopolysaccharide biosynthesis protein n=1 Tax=Staphylococcus massiliensis TaxID=555791 RepID=UPI001EE0A976|nr:oligosaccharide flippase family protein [Staphylococcus massiliensis]MCG3402302.1 oligosaccharide flippase family protein [Staphylococcus massiliensis]